MNTKIIERYIILIASSLIQDCSYKHDYGLVNQIFLELGLGWLKTEVYYV